MCFSVLPVLPSGLIRPSPPACIGSSCDYWQRNGSDLLGVWFDSILSEDVAGVIDLFDSLLSFVQLKISFCWHCVILL